MSSFRPSACKIGCRAIHTSITKGTSINDVTSFSWFFLPLSLQYHNFFPVLHNQFFSLLMTLSNNILRGSDVIYEGVQKYTKIKVFLSWSKGLIDCVDNGSIIGPLFPCARTNFLPIHQSSFYKSSKWCQVYLVKLKFSEKATQIWRNHLSLSFNIT